MCCVEAQLCAGAGGAGETRRMGSVGTATLVLAGGLRRGEGARRHPGESALVGESERGNGCYQSGGGFALSGDETAVGVDVFGAQ